MKITTCVPIRFFLLLCCFFISAETEAQTNVMQQSYVSVSPYDQTILVGNADLKAGNFSEAHQAAMKALSLDGNRFEAYALESLALFKQGKTDQAKAFMDIAMAKAPPNKKSQLEALAATIDRSSNNNLSNANTSAETTPPPASVATDSELSGDDRVQYDALLSVLADADKANSLDERHKILEEFLDQSSPFLQKHPNLPRLWVARAAIAIELDQVNNGWEAGQKISELGLKNSTDPAVAKVIGELFQKGWLIPLEGNAYLARQDYANAFESFQKAAAQGNAVAQFELGRMYWQGQGVAQDEAQAARCYQQSAAQGNVNAQLELGRLYKHNWGVTQDYATALNWLHKAAAQGNADAEFEVGQMYREGQGVTKDYTRAVDWLQQSASQGNADAQNVLGQMYEDGQGVSQNYTRALDYYFKAATQGNVDAQVNLGLIYLDGLGVAKDTAQASNWFTKAHAQGNPRGPDGWDNYVSGLLNEASGDLNAAEESFYRAVQLNSQFSAANDRLEIVLKLEASDSSSPRTFAQLQNFKRMNFLKRFAGTWEPDAAKSSGKFKLWMNNSNTLDASGEFKFKKRVAEGFVGFGTIDIYRYNCKIDAVDLAPGEIDSALLNDGQVTARTQGDCQYSQSHRKRYFDTIGEAHSAVIGGIEYVFLIYGSPIIFPTECLAAHRTSDTFNGQFVFSSNGDLSFAKEDEVIFRLKKVSNDPGSERSRMAAANNGTIIK